MDEKVLPVMVTTYEAFCVCMEGNAKAIYLYMELYRKHAKEIYQALEERGYKLPGLPTQRGVLFVKGIDVEQCVFPSPSFL